MLNTKKLFTKVLNSIKNDYIVEQGASGIWTYRKWNSGIAECWGNKVNVSIPTGWSSAGVDIDLPFKFITVTLAQVQFRNYQIARAYLVVPNNATSVNIQTNSDSALSTGALTAIVKGTWK